jgi:uncharacterized ferredoxin-like protein
METLKKFLAILPVIAQIVPATGELGTIEKLIVDGEEEISRRMSEGSQTREEVLSDAADQWDEDMRKAAALALLGHEGDQQPSS